MIKVENLTKQYGNVTAVENLSFQVKPGIVTGFLGPNGAGKSTTMRMIMGLDAPNCGTATVNGKRLAKHGAPLTEIGALLDARSFHPKRSARNHLLALANTTGISPGRVDELLELVGLSAVANKRAGTFSLGMAQRLGIASALIGDPAVVMFDEPVNGLDPEGVLWVRNLLKDLANEGRTVLVSSHLMSEMALTAGHFIVIGQGKLLVDVSAAKLEEMGSVSRVTVQTNDQSRLRELLSHSNARITGSGEGPLEVVGLTASEVGRAAYENGLMVVELTSHSSSLEDTFMRLTSHTVQYQAKPLTSDSKAKANNAL